MNRSVRFAALIPLFLMISCSTLPKAEHKIYAFPKDIAFVDEPPAGRSFKILGWVRAKEDFVTINPDANVNLLCQNYYNKGANSLVREAKKVGGDAVVQIRTVVFLLNGAMEEHKTAECSDDGGEGEILMKGVAIKWIPDPNAPRTAKPKKSASAN